MQITATMVKELRERTGAGMMDCKKVLAECGGDLEVAIEQMRKSGQAKANKKAGRIASEGVIVIASGDQQAAIVEVNCETDFVAKDEQFSNFSKQLAQLALQNDLNSMERLNDTAMPSGETVAQARLELVRKIGENIVVRRFEKITSDHAISCYVHGKRIGVLVDHSGNDEVGRDIAMHIAAVHPICVSAAEMPAEVLDKERDIAQAQAAGSGKPADIVAKIAVGKVNKFLKENTLLGQAFVKDDHLSVEKYLKTANASVEKFVLFELGEGLEKRSENFADEVQKQIDDVKN